MLRYPSVPWKAMVSAMDSSWARLLEVDQGALCHDSRGKVGLGHLPAFVGHLDRLAGHLELAPEPNRCLQALGEGLREGRHVRGFYDASRRIDVQPDGQVERRDSHRLRALRSIEQPLTFRQLNLDPKSLLLLQSSALFQLLGH